ncbi:MAG: hypothetical protein ACT4QE_23265 [Anaerolineales bacterium]
MRSRRVGGYWVSEGAWGATVRVVRTLFDGQQTEEWMPAVLAVHEVLHSPQNGRTVASARIDFGGLLDVWGTSYVPLNGGDGVIPNESL